MVVPLRDQNGRVRYYLGAQLDITELVNTCTGLESLQRLIDRQSLAPGQRNEDEVKVQLDQMAEFQQLSETFSNQELQSLLGSQERKQLDDQVTHGPDGYQAQPVRHKNPSANVDSSSRLPGIGSAPPLGFYKNVSHPSCNLALPGLKIVVFTCSTAPFSPYSLCFARSAGSWYPAIAAHGTDWRKSARSR